MKITSSLLTLGILITGILGITGGTAFAQNQTAKVNPNFNIGYYEYLPPGYNSNTDNYPVVIFLHGLGERGNGTTDLFKVANNGPAKHVKNGYKFPFILISPQLTTALTDWPPTYIDAMIEYVKTYLRIDVNRIYLTGLSLGGGGTWWYAQNATYTNKLAAIAVVCGSRNLTSSACNIANENLPVWAFHGDADGTISVNKTINMVNAINACVPTPNPLALMTIYPGLGHNVWDNAYRTDNSLHTPNVYEWMMQYSKATLQVSAGADKTINLPTSSTTLPGTATTGSGTITSYAWQQINGPAATLANATTPTLSVSNLVQGVYTFRLVVTNSLGDTAQDDVVVTVVMTNQVPVANAGLDQTITLPTNSILITGSGTDTDGSISTYVWAKVSGPTATANGTSTPNLSLTNMLQGTYVYSLTVTDNQGATASDNVQIIVNAAAVNQSPTANAGPDKTVNLPTSTTNLAGSGADPDGSISSYLWTKMTGPTVSMTNITTPTLSLASLQAGSYVFRLTVTDNQGATAFDEATVTVVAANQAPTANAGADLSITLPTSTANIAGSGVDPDGSIANYLWTQFSGPNSATLSNTTTPTLSASGLIQGVYVFRLTVTDNNGATGLDNMSLTVNAAPVNIPPTANAGLDLGITLPTNSVTINGSGVDSDGSISSYSWSLISGPTATLNNQTTPNLSVTSMLAGSYTFRLTVTDNQGATGIDNVVVTVQPAVVNQSPVANAGPDAGLTLPSNSITLNGSGTDSDGTIASYQWIQVSGPVTTLAGQSTQNLAVSNMVAGIHVFRLTVTDNQGATSFDEATVTVSASNVAPTANAGADQTLTLPTNSTTINGSGLDSDGSIVSYQWSVVSGPGAVSLANDNTPTVGVSSLIAGTYTLRLTVTDDDAATGTDDVKVIVIATNQAPVANAGPDKSITLPTNTVNFTGSGVDPDGSITSYNWANISGPPATLANQTTPTLTASNLTAGTYVFRLVVTDNLGLPDFDDVTLIVNPLATNLAPSVEAGPNQTITLPVNSTTLPGSAFDTDGSIASYLWSKVSGPTLGLANENTSTLSVSSLVEGTYVLRLTATDNGGLSSFDDVTVNVLPQAVNQIPVANAGADQTITLPTSGITLFGSGSDPDGSVTAYAWSQVSGPAATLANQTTPTLTLSNLVQGVFTFKLDVSDNQGATASDQVVVTVNAMGVNQNPTANAGPDITISLPANIATISGSGSDTDGSIIGYLWSKLSGPGVTMGATNAASLSVSDLVEGSYVFELQVTDNLGATDVDNVSLIVLPAGLNQAPAVNAGADKVIFLPSNSVVLTGSVSDSDGTITTKGWTQVSGPIADLVNASTPTLTVNNLQEGISVFRLSATDDDGASTSDDAIVTVNSATANQPPVANAGSDKTIKLPVNSITLFGVGTDADGTIAAYSWAKVSGPPCTLGSTDVQDLVITNMEEGSYQFSLTVTDDDADTHTDNVSVTVLSASFNLPPFVDAGPNISLQLPDNSSVINGVVSDDGTIASIQWTQVSGPSTATIASAGSATPTVSGLQLGTYVFMLSATDDAGETSTDNATIVVNEATPPAPTIVVDAGPDVTLQLPNSDLDITASVTTDNVLITEYKWTQQSGSLLTILNDSTQQLALPGLPIGAYSFRLTVTDATAQTASDDVDVLVLEANPVLAAQNTFSPNNDGQFDTWRINNPQLAVGCSIVVYTRGGQKVFESSGYDIEWDGLFKGSPLPEGVYFYQITCDGDQQTGSITLVR